MTTRRYAMLAGSALTLMSSVAGAQQSRTAVPPGQMPSAGMCRIWIDGVPAGRQPKATDCDTARRNAPRNSRVLYGSNSNDRNSSTYDPRYDSRNDDRDRRDSDNDRSKWEIMRERELQKARIKRQKELAKAERKRERDRDSRKADDRWRDR